MKLAAPKTPAEYFFRTSHAVRHAYVGLDMVHAFAREAGTYEWPPVEKDGMLCYLPPQTPEQKADLERQLELYRQYFERKISEAMFAGFVLEAAYIAIRVFSHNNAIPETCADLVPANHSAVQFCIGAERHGIPMGLIVYAGRNQYAHWDEDEPRPVTRKIFSALDRAFSDNPWADLAFDLGNPTINIYAGEVLLTALGWTSYEKYLVEMTNMLVSEAAR